MKVQKKHIAFVLISYYLISDFFSNKFSENVTLFFIFRNSSLIFEFEIVPLKFRNGKVTKSDLFPNCFTTWVWRFDQFEASSRKKVLKKVSNERGTVRAGVSLSA